MNILVIIVTYNAMKWALKCFGTLLSKQGHKSVNIDVFVVDNGSTDGTIDYIKRNYPQVNIYISPENLGFGKANNIGLRYMLNHGYDYAYLLNQDAWVTPEAIAQLVNVHKQHMEFGVLSPMQLQANQNHLDGNFLKNICSECHKYVDDVSNGRRNDIYEIPSVMAAHWLLSRYCVETVGLFSPTFPHYGEDDNYLDRVLFHNLKVGMAPAIIAVHDREARKNDIDKLLYLSCYINHLFQLSRIKRPPVHLLIKGILRTNLSYFFAYRSMRPLNYTIRLLFEIKEINNNRKITLHKKAFL